jgi:8-oxo-dGTP pyrophosphatase MutT (NUDIX family)
MKIKPVFPNVLQNQEIQLGWRKGEGNVVLINPKLGEVVHVLICDDEDKGRWDQFLHCEPIGAICIPIRKDGKVGLVEVERPSFKEETLQRFPLTENDYQNLGRKSLEFPRGFPKKGESASQTAIREAEEEIDSPIIRIEKIGVVTPNTAFHPHQIPVFLVQINENFKGQIPPDVNEKIFGKDWFTREEMNKKIEEGQIYCGITLAAWAIFLAKGLWKRCYLKEKTN